MDHGQDNTVLGFHEGGWIRGDLHTPSGGGPRREQSEIGMPECCAPGLVCIFISRVAAGSVTQAVVLSLIAFGMGPHSSWNLHKRYPTTHCQKLRRTVGKCPVSARLSRCWRPSFFAVSPGGVWRAVHALPGWPPSTTTPHWASTLAATAHLAGVGARRRWPSLRCGHTPSNRPASLPRSHCRGTARRDRGAPILGRLALPDETRNPEPGTRNPEPGIQFRL